MDIVCVDWKQADRERLAPLYAAETARWSVVLGWDTAASWHQVELGRRLGTVFGFLAFDANGAVAGWTFFLLHRGVLQIGGFLAASERATDALLDAILASSVAARAQAVSVFAFTDAPRLTAALGQRGLTVVQYDYLQKPLAGGLLPPIPHLRAWRDDDTSGTAALLASAYPLADDGRPFAPRGTAEEWREYVGQLVGAAGCGTLLPDASFVVQAGDEAIAGLVLTTRLAPGTAHIAQIAVAPRAQRRGLGRLLLRAASVRARAAGCDRVTLLVEERNAGARQLYEASGFAAAARFVSAGSVQPVRLTSLAAGGSAVTRP
jgi:ribosomal protein S18 acetylase RimI-like enzyme